MKVDVTAIFFNSIIEGGTATPPWCVSIGQGKEKKINNDIIGLDDILSGLIYKSLKDRALVDLSDGSKNNEYILISLFDKVFVNGVLGNNLRMIIALVREHTSSHDGRLRISLPPYAKYRSSDLQFSNKDSYQKISNILNCGNIENGGCWFVDDITIQNQDELHLSCVVVDSQKPTKYKTSQLRSLEWQMKSGEVHTIPHNYPDIPLQLICYGAPGTGKSHFIDEKIDDGNAIRTTFHPDTDYASFVGAYKPTMEPMPIHAIVGMDAKHARGENGEKAYEQKIIYKYVPQAFLKAYVAAWSNLEKPFYLVIEEINRGNCAQIFGDLFQLLDRNNTGCSSYPIHADEDIQRFLASDSKGFAGLDVNQKEAIRNFTLHKDNGKIISIGEDLLNGTKLLLPPNLHIWATMNTSDQSLFPIDSAFKRRWNWKYIPIDYNKENWTFEIGSHRYSWGDFLRKINPEIYALTESADKQMGYYFAKADPQNGVISEDVFVNKVLFYLWTDVFKDYDISGDLFRNKEQNRPFRFSDFFEDNHALETFIQGIGLEPEAKSQEPTLPQEYGNNNMEDKYILDGTGYKSIGEVVQAIISALAKEYSFADIEKKFKSFITKNRKGEPAISKEKIEVLQAKENGGPNRWYKNAFISKDGIEFHLFNGWYDHDYKAIKNLVDDCRNIFPNGIQQQPTSNK